MKRTLVLALAVALTLSACGDKTPTAPANSPASDLPASASAEPAPSSAQDQYRVALSEFGAYKTASDAYTNAMETSDVAAAKTALTGMLAATQSFNQRLVDMEPAFDGDQAVMASYKQHVGNLVTALEAMLAAPDASGLAGGYSAVTAAQTSISRDDKALKAELTRASTTPSTTPPIADSKVFATKLLAAAKGSKLAREGYPPAWKTLGVGVVGYALPAGETEVSGYISLVDKKTDSEYIATAIKDAKGVCTGLVLTISEAGMVSAGKILSMPGMPCRGQDVGDKAGLG